MNIEEPRQPPQLRKLLVGKSAEPRFRDPASGNEIDVSACAVVHFSSEHPEYPVDYLFDGYSGPGATKWMSARRNSPETILLIFDEPTNISNCAFEAEERDIARTQEVCAEYVAGDNRSYGRSFIQEFNFSPDGATYQNEFIAVDLRDVRRFRLSIRPDKSGHGFASLTTLRLFR